MGSVRVESQPPFSRNFAKLWSFTSTPNIASIAELVRYSDPARTTPLEGFAYPLLTETEAFDWPLGPPAWLRCPGPGCIGQLAFPVVSHRSAIAIQNLVPQPGLTNIAFFLYDANGLVDTLCRTLSDQQVEYINLAIWDTLSPGFRGSAVISATSWQHPAFDPASGLPINPVGLAAVIVERKLPESPTTPSDERAGSIASGSLAPMGNPLSTIPVIPADYGPPTTALCDQTTQ